jgi:hypothetical protein
MLVSSNKILQFFNGTRVVLFILLFLLTEEMPGIYSCLITLCQMHEPVNNYVHSSFFKYMENFSGRNTI